MYAKGDVFHGEWANGVKNGQGQLTYKNGDLFHGAWVDDHANGHGTSASTRPEPSNSS